MMLWNGRMFFPGLKDKLDKEGDLALDGVCVLVSLDSDGVAEALCCSDPSLDDLSSPAACLYFSEA